MSVIAKINNQEGYEYFIKGAPEKLKQICTNIPDNYDKTVNELCIKGYRLLALGSKPIKQAINNMDTIQRNELENNIIFIGFLIIDNKLKYDTAKRMLELKNAGYDLKIISGDSPLTVVNTGKLCHILEPEKPVYIVETD